MWTSSTEDKKTPRKEKIPLEHGYIDNMTNLEVSITMIEAKCIWQAVIPFQFVEINHSKWMNRQARLVRFYMNSNYTVCLIGKLHFSYTSKDHAIHLKSFSWRRMPNPSSSWDPRNTLGWEGVRAPDANGLLLVRSTYTRSMSVNVMQSPENTHHHFIAWSDWVD
jgi:hypothetical protein